MHPGHIHTHLGGHTFILSSGQWCHYPLRAGAEKYGKLCYSTAFGYAVPVGTLLLDQHAPDCAIALSDDEGVVWKVRRECDDARLEFSTKPDPVTGNPTPWLRAVWRPWKDVEVETILVPPHPASPLWHLRVHRLRTGRELRSSDAGFSNYGQRKDGRALDLLQGDVASILMSEGDVLDGKLVSSTVAPAGPAPEAWALASSEGGVVAVMDLTQSLLPRSSYPTAGESRDAEVTILDANSNIVFSRSVMPTVLGHHVAASGKDEWFVTGIFALPSRVGEKGVPKSKWVEEWSKRPQVPNDIMELIKRHQS